MSLPEKHHVTDFVLTPDATGAGTCTTNVLVILNYKLPAFVPVLWNQAARLRICADGGANRLYDELPTMFPGEHQESVRKRYVPDVIKGDLDSIRNDVRSFYAELGSSIIDASDDQDTTDLHKCIALVVDSTPNIDTSNLKILVVGALGGRMDHEFGNMNVLYRFAHIPIIVLNDQCLLFCLPAGFHHVIRPNRKWEGPHCGLIPLGQPSKGSTTTGLQWNLNSLPMAFGTLVSTSNRIVSDVVTVVSDVTLLWTTELRLEHA